MERSAQIVMEVDKHINKVNHLIDTLEKEVDSRKEIIKKLKEHIKEISIWNFQ